MVLLALFSQKYPFEWFGQFGHFKYFTFSGCQLIIDFVHLFSYIKYTFSPLSLSLFPSSPLFPQKSTETSFIFGGSRRLPLIMPFKRFVEIGKVALVNYGEDYGKFVVIVDDIDQNRALVDSPGMLRSRMNFKRISLTDIMIDIKRVSKKKVLVAAMEAADVKGKWEKSSWGRKLIVQKRRASFNDFDRFKLMIAKIKKAGVARQELAKLKKETAS